MPRSHKLWSLLLACLVAPATAWPCSEGRVFEDANGDGIRQSDEQGLAGVRVSDGSAVVSSDAGGDWRGLSPARDGHVFVVKPAGYAIATAADGLPAFWRRSGVSDPACEFGLRRRDSRQSGLKVIVTSDPQVGNAREVGYHAQIVERSLAPQRDAALGLTLGDIANDDVALYPSLNRATASLGLPWLHVAGNHDLDAAAMDDEASLSTFRRVFGPDTYAWEEHEATFVMLDNVVTMPGRRPSYVGGLREGQFRLLERLLEGMDRDRLLVVAAHIPWFDTAADGRPYSIRQQDRARLFALLKPFPKLLLLSGHRHTQRRFFHGPAQDWHGPAPLHEYNVGAMSGAYWSGVGDAAGIPVSTMADGTPRGFATLRIAAAGAYRLAWHPTLAQGEGDPAFTDAMALHAPRVLRRGAYPAWGVYANVFLGYAGMRVEYRIGEGRWTPMERVQVPDPRLLMENVRDDLSDGLRSFDRSPEAEVSQHLWRGALETGLAAGEHRVEVRAVDEHGDEQRAALSYRLVDAQP